MPVSDSCIKCNTDVIASSKSLCMVICLLSNYKAGD